MQEMLFPELLFPSEDGSVISATPEPAHSSQGLHEGSQALDFHFVYDWVIFRNAGALTPNHTPVKTGFSPPCSPTGQ